MRIDSAIAALRCDRVALMQAGRVLEVDAPAAIGQGYPLPLVAVRGPRRYELLLALRSHPHAHSVYPFGEELHYTDAREGTDPGVVAHEMRSWLEERGYVGADVTPIAAGIEDSFMQRMDVPAA